MRKNIIQQRAKTADGKSFIENDWFGAGIPANVSIAEGVYFDTSYGFDAFESLLPDAMTVGRGCGFYDRASFLVGSAGKITIGEFNMANGSTFICNHMITVGDHCMFAWGSVITDSWVNPVTVSKQQRRRLMQTSGSPSFNLIAPVIIENNVWVGFDAVILPGVKLGRGCIVGAKSVVTADVPPYAIVAGNPGRVIRYLDPNDTAEARERALTLNLA
jgi:acetyltransferase-like isoleucine patch superfamily enzyme